MNIHIHIYVYMYVCIYIYIHVFKLLVSAWPRGVQRIEHFTNSPATRSRDVGRMWVTVSLSVSMPIYIYIHVYIHFKIPSFMCSGHILHGNSLKYLHSCFLKYITILNLLHQQFKYQIVNYHLTFAIKINKSGRSKCALFCTLCIVYYKHLKVWWLTPWKTLWKKSQEKLENIRLPCLYTL